MPGQQAQLDDLRVGELGTEVFPDLVGQVARVVQLVDGPDQGPLAPRPAPRIEGATDGVDLVDVKPEWGAMRRWWASS